MDGFTRFKGVLVDEAESATISKMGSEFVASLTCSRSELVCIGKGSTPEAAYAAMRATKVTTLPQIPAGKRVSIDKVVQEIAERKMTKIGVWSALGYSPVTNVTIYFVLSRSAKRPRPIHSILARRFYNFFGDAVLEAAP